MTTPPAYDDQNVFAKILRGELPCHKVCEDELTLAFMDIMPRTDGHLLVVPKAPARNLFDIQPDDLAAVMRTVQKLARAARAALGADGISIQQFNESAGGQVVFHLHVHVLPRWEGRALKPPATEKGDPARLRDLAARIGAAAREGGAPLGGAPASF